MIHLHIQLDAQYNIMEILYPYEVGNKAQYDAKKIL